MYLIILSTESLYADPGISQTDKDKIPDEIIQIGKSWIPIGTQSRSLILVKNHLFKTVVLEDRDCYLFSFILFVRSLWVFVSADTDDPPYDTHIVPSRP